MASSRKGEVDSDSLFRGFRWIPWLISDPSGAAVGCCWTESTVRICADLGCRGNTSSHLEALEQERQVDLRIDRERPEQPIDPSMSRAANFLVELVLGLVLGTQLGGGGNDVLEHQSHDRGD